MKGGRKKLCLPQGGMGPRYVGLVSFYRCKTKIQETRIISNYWVTGFTKPIKESPIMDPILLSSIVERLFSV